MDFLENITRKLCGFPNGIFSVDFTGESQEAERPSFSERQIAECGGPEGETNSR